MKTCTVSGCQSPLLAKGMCNRHYKRHRRTGGTRLMVVPTIPQRLLAGHHVDDNGCWIWTGAPGLNGYARLSVDNRLQYAHRVSYETFVGPIPKGLTIDHLCRVPMCINPEHLEPVTLAENTRRELAVRYQDSEKVS